MAGLVSRALFACSLAICVLLSSSTSNSVDAGMDRLKDAFEVLQSIPSGRALFARAMRQWDAGRKDELLRYFHWGTVSRTDAVLTRRLDPETGRETRERRVVIYLKRDQRLDDLVLDIAHELTHALGGPSWDPYDPDLTAISYIRSSIEARGGEIDALLMECKVEKELRDSFGVKSSRCSRYEDEGSSGFVREKVMKDFYRVGRWMQGFRAEMGSGIQSFRLLSSEAPQLYSSTGQAPYPVALLREFRAITANACENSRRRLQSIAEGRAPAGRSSIARSTEQFLSKRCRPAS